MYDLLSIITSYQRFEESRISRNFDNTIRSKRFEQVDAYSINIDLQELLAEKHQLSYGAEQVLNRVDSKGIQEDITLHHQEREAITLSKSIAEFCGYICKGRLANSS